MPRAFHDVFRDLCDPVPTRRREALTLLEHLPQEEIERFCVQARNLSFSESLELCAVLGGAAIAPLIDLLAYYATSPERALRERALATLTVVPAELRSQSITRLLESTEPDIRAAACRILAEGGSQAARGDLVRHLKDPDSSVVLEALQALEQLQCFDASEEIQPLLTHVSESVRIRAIEVLVALAPDDELPASPLISRLRHDIRPQVRITACWAFGKRPLPEAKAHLLELSLRAPLQTLQVAAISALGVYPERDVAIALMQLGAMHQSPAIAIQCRRSLNRFPDELLLSVSDEMLDDPDPGVRMEVASVVGDLTFSNAPRILIRHLHAESDDLTRAAIVEALGRGGWSEAWNAVRLCVGEDILVAYPAVAALAELLDHAHLDDFVHILVERPEETLQEAVLKRLAIYGRSNALPPEILDNLRPFFGSENWMLVSLALRTVANLSDSSIAQELLDVWARQHDASLRTEAGLAIRRLTHESAYELLMVAGDSHLAQIAGVLQYYEALGPQAEDCLLRLLYFIRNDTKYARDCLDACVQLAPQVVQDLLMSAETEEASILLEAWNTVPEPIRRKLKLDTVRLLKIGDTQMRHSLLQTVHPPVDDALLAQVVEIALLEPDDTVRQMALHLTRRLVEHGKDETCEAISV